ncbi:MAG: UvrD-helicase domain-containing protein [Nocardioides sp.]|nr:UvrD-helicase domain-containing protein [Nocardioides sp.]
MSTPFDLAGPLPTGTTLLEASAGTGKTWTIGALVARYVAEGVTTLDQMLVVTFGRAASQELRERVRTQLVEVERALAGSPVSGDPSDLVTLLVDGPPGSPVDAAERAVRLRRVRTALSGFDAATIVTTHQFCQLVLRGLGVAGDTDGEARLVEDLDELRGEVVDDLYLRLHGDGPPLLPHGQAAAVARAATGDPQARLEPTEAGEESLPGTRVAFGNEVRAEMDHRKRRLGVLSYDDLLSQLADALADEAAPARARMRRRWSVVLVDEFQDTDPVQWQVLDRAFSGHATLVLIGDPKQAIYAFRGGDVSTYLQATESATTHQTLGVNWRSDAPLVAAVQALMENAALGDPRITVRPVRAAWESSRLEGAGEPLRLRAVRAGSVRGGKGEADRVRQHVVDDLARDVQRLLGSGATYDGRELRPADVAVLAHKHQTLRAVQEALAARGIPAVVAGGGSVFATPAAADWVALLEGLEQPHRSSRVRAAALTQFFGHDAVALDTEGDGLTDRVAGRLRTWAELLVTRGVAAVMEAATRDGLTARVLGGVDGDRRLTDLRHVAQALHRAAVDDQLGLVALLGWLREQRADDKLEVSSDRTRRLDSDAAAVQLVTIHASKGLEYPVVYLPHLWDRWVSDPAVPLFHAADDGQRRIDVGGPGRGNPGWADHVAAHQREEAGESLRLLYVALTRARSQVVVWWAPTWRNTECSALHRVLFGRRPGFAEVPDRMGVKDDAHVALVLDAWRAAGGAAWEWVEVAEPPAVKVEQPRPALAVRRFARTIDAGWRRTSYSGLSAAVRAVPDAGPTVGSEPEAVPREDEPARATPAGPETDAASDDPAVAAAREVASPMADLPVGATFGSLVHGVLEHADPDAPDLDAELHARLDDELVRWPVPLDRHVLVAALRAVCASPLGPLAAERTLGEIPLTDRLSEMDFELPLAGGDTARGRRTARPVLLGDLAPLLRRHLPADDPLLPYAEQVDDPVLGGQELRGYLTGSVDVVLRVPGPAGPRFLVVDYKTNWLGGDPDATEGPRLTAADYRPQALAAAMGHSDYPLQALLYAVVLHRYLRWRLPDYDPTVHVGGVLYLYLRGMCGPETPVLDGGPCGVFAWQPPPALVVAVSDLLDGVGEGDR